MQPHEVLQIFETLFPGNIRSSRFPSRNSVFCILIQNSEFGIQSSFSV